MPIPVHWKIAVNHANAIVYDFVAVRKIIAADVLYDRAAAAKFGEFFDEPGERILIGGLVTNRDVNFNASLWCEAWQGASFSIQRYSSTGDEIRRLRFLLSPTSSQWRPESRLGTYSSCLFSAMIIIRSAASYQEWPLINADRRGSDKEKNGKGKRVGHRRNPLPVGGEESRSLPQDGLPRVRKNPFHDRIASGAELFPGGFDSFVGCDFGICGGAELVELGRVRDAQAGVG